jgi:hypothetical protein
MQVSPFSKNRRQNFSKFPKNYFSRITEFLEKAFTEILKNRGFTRGKKLIFFNINLGSQIILQNQNPAQVPGF